MDIEEIDSRCIFTSPEAFKRLEKGQREFSLKIPFVVSLIPDTEDALYFDSRGIYKDIPADWISITHCTSPYTVYCDENTESLTPALIAKPKLRNARLMFYHAKANEEIIIEGWLYVVNDKEASESLCTIL